MLPTTHLLQTVPPRISRALTRIEKLIWSKGESIPVYHAEASESHLTYEEATLLPLQIAEAPMVWGKSFDQKWFKIEIPKDAPDGAYLHWPAQGECTAYIDGVPYYGFDIAHTHCQLPHGTKEVWVDAMCMENGIWAPGGGAITADGCRFTGAFLTTRNDLAWDCYHDLWFLFELARDEHQANFPPGTPFPGLAAHLPPLENVSVLYRRLLRLMSNAVNAFDTSGLTSLSASLKEAYEALPASGPSMDFVATGHGHIDLVWLWTEKAAAAKAVHTFSTMNRLMEIYPEFRFGYSQPASYAAVGRRSPCLLDQVKERISEGRWEATGAAEVESDTNLSCGEALARSLIVGQRRFQELRNSPSKVLWLPDVFGYCAALPQILQQMEVPYFFTTKLLWNTINHFPYTSFVWRGPDGSEVLACLMPENGFGYNGSATPAEMRTATRTHRQADIHTEVLAPTGFGDGGGGTTEAMCERIRRAKNLAGVPKARWGLIEEFFDRLAPLSPELPVYQGELYLEYHRGVYTTQSQVKAAYRRCEKALQIWESVRCALGTGEIDQEIWQRVIFTQFHDYLPGSSRQEVYEEGLPELRTIVDTAIANTRAELETEHGASALWNPLPYTRMVLIDGQARSIPPLSGSPVANILPLGEASQLTATASAMSNGIVEVGFDSSGRVVTLSVRGRDVALCGPAGDFHIYPDHPHFFDSWDIDRDTLSIGHAAPAGANFISATVCDGIAEAHFSRRLTDKSTVEIRYILEDQGTALRIDYTLEWQDTETLLKAVFPTTYNGSSARYGTPFGSILRSQQPGKRENEAQWEVPASRYAIISDEGDSEGLAIITEDKYGFSGRSGVMELSLVRSPEVPSAQEEMTLRRLKELRPYSDLGTHHIRIALSLHDSALPREEQPAALAETLFTPCIPYQGDGLTAGFLGLKDGNSLQPCWAKPALDGSGWILRLHETLGQRGTAQLLLAEGYQASATDLQEREGREVQSIVFKPYELHSVRISKSHTPPGSHREP